MLAAGTWRHYDLGGNSRDYDVITPSGERLGDQRVRVYRNVTRVYYQDASFTKLREVTLGARIPRSWLSRVRGMNGVTGAEFTLSGPQSSSGGPRIAAATRSSRTSAPATTTCSATASWPRIPRAGVSGST
jgi:hypothetical protein